MTDSLAPEQCVIWLKNEFILGKSESSGDKLYSFEAIEGQPILGYLLWHARRFGFKRVLLLVPRDADRLLERVRASIWNKYFEIEVFTGSVQNDMGGLLYEAASLLDERFLLLDGEKLFDMNWLDICALCIEHRATVAVALRRETNPKAYGTVESDGELIRQFDPECKIEGGIVAGGVYVVDRSIVELCTESSSFENDVLPALAAGGHLVGREQFGYYLDAGKSRALGGNPLELFRTLSRGAVFFDRDGVLNVDVGYLYRWEEFEWTDGAIAAIKYANDQNLFTFVVTNQSGVARGYYTEDSIRVLHSRMQGELRARGAHLDDIRYCPHHPDGVVPLYSRKCECRKPGPGMIVDLIGSWPVKAVASHLFGDKQSDIDAAIAAGILATEFTGGSLETAVAAVVGSAGGRGGQLVRA